LHSDLQQEKIKLGKQSQELNKAERMQQELSQQNGERQKALDMLNMKMNENDRQKRKILRENVQLENDKERLNREKLEA